MLQNYQSYQSKRLAKHKNKWNPDGSLMKLPETKSFLRQSSQASLNGSRTNLHRSPSFNRFEREISQGSRDNGGRLTKAPSLDPRHFTLDARTPVDNIAPAAGFSTAVKTRPVLSKMLNSGSQVSL